MEPLYFCEGELAVLSAFDFSYLPQLLLYSFIPSTILALLFSVFIFIKDSYSIRSLSLLLASLCFSLWSLNDTLQWITVPANLNLYFWQITALFELSVALFLYLFVRLYLSKTNSLNKIEKILIPLAILPVLVLLPTKINISGFDLVVCEGVVGPLIDYVHYLSIFIAAILLFFAYKIVYDHKKIPKEERGSYSAKSITAASASLFLIIFTLANIVGETTKEYVIGLIAPIGMNLFLIFLAYTVVKFKSFNIKLAGAQALVIGLISLVGSQLFFVENITNRVLVSFTLAISTLGGILLVRSVKKEIKQREELEVLTVKLEKANDKLKELDKLKSEFVSIASHQLRSPLTAIRGYASLLLEGSFGNLPEKAQEPLQRIEESSKLMAVAVEDYLNVSRIESGNMKYNKSDFNLKDEVENICDDLRADAIKKGLTLLFRTSLKSKGIINADIGKTIQVVQNLIHNSVKYTPQGSVKVMVRDDVANKKIYVDIEDTGIGMTQKTIDSLFEKFTRAEGANKVNVKGTGLGLFVAKKMAVAMGGNITAHSDGEGKGSRFTVEMPLAM